MPKNTRKDILAHVKELQLCEPEEAPIFDHIISAIHGLQVHDGYRCGYGGCGFFAGTIAVIKRHCGTHGPRSWSDVEKRFTAVKVQTFFQGHNTRYGQTIGGSNGRYFEVHDPEALHARNFTEQLLLGLVNTADERDRQHKEELNNVSDMQSLVTKTPWLRYTKWEETFIGCDMKALHDWTDIPNWHDEEGAVVVDCMDKALRNCWEGYRDCAKRGWQLLPFWLSSVNRDKEETKPFRSYFPESTLSHYIAYWQSYIIFCIRAYQAEDSLVQFTQAQQFLLDEILVQLQTYTSDNQQAVTRLLFDFSISCICHSDYAKERSSLILFTGVRGYNVVYKQWRQPKDYMTILAGLQFCIRMLILEHALPMSEREEFSELSTEDPVQRFCVFRNKWLVDGESGHLINSWTDNRHTIWIHPPHAELWICCK